MAHLKPIIMSSQNLPPFGSRSHLEMARNRFEDVAFLCANLDTVMFEFADYFTAWVAYYAFEPKEGDNFKALVLSSAMDVILHAPFYKRTDSTLHLSCVYDRIVMAVNQYLNQFDYYM